MDEKMYQSFNDIWIDLNEYHEEEVAQVNKDRWIRRAKKSVRRNGIGSLLKGVAAVMILGIGVGYALPIYAMNNPLIYKIADFMGATKSFERYSTVINESVTKKDITVQLGEAIWDNGELTVTMRITCKDPLPEDFRLWEGEMYINGNKVELDSVCSERKIDDYTVEIAVSEMEVGEVKGDIGIQIILKEFIRNQKIIKDEWRFKFITNGDELMGETVEIPLQQTLVLPNGEKIIVEAYMANTVSQKIHFRKLNPLLNYQMEFSLWDEEGNEFKAQASVIDLTGGVFKWEGIEWGNNTTLRLKLKVAEYGKAYEDVEEEIIINIF